MASGATGGATGGSGPVATSMTTTYGDISPRTAAYAAKELLERGQPLLVLEKLAQSKPLPSKSSTEVKFRRYNSLAPALTPLTEGVTPAGKKLSSTDYPAQLKQYGDWVELTDIIMDHHEDPVLKDSVAILGEQAAETIELVRYGVLKAGTASYWAKEGGAGQSRGEVNAPLTIGLQRMVTQKLRAQLARFYTSVVRSTPSFGTVNVAPSYFAVAHTDCESMIREMKGFCPVEDYGNYGDALEGEVGKVENVRYLLTTVCEPFLGAGAAAVVTDGATPPVTIRTNQGDDSTPSKSHVYPILFFGRDSWGDVPFKGKNAVRPMVLNPNVPRGGDPIGQRGSVAWKTSHTAVILNQAWMFRLEVAVPMHQG